jgi:flagellar biosynthesis/type III secretory pathway protein FliH
VRHAIEQVNGRDVARIRAHPDHVAAIRQHLSARPTMAAAVEPDPSLAPGSVVFDTAMGTLDASVETQLAEIENGLADRLGGAA